MSSFLWPIGPYWCFLAFGPHHLSLARSCIFGPFGQSFTSPTPRPIPFFWALGVHLYFLEPLAPLETTRALGPTRLIMGFLGHLAPQLPLPSTGHNPRPTLRGTLRPLLANHLPSRPAGTQTTSGPT
ncbi:hypothetical protein O181_114844 [Austropuccinia psidii MF-1]|uniref:Uncharacterized protein n=1 Tax=Austropuccinia psidii MF-1 TaxID=1389203 RepID=A0A9Q3K605_9BASI|nr:hypothetical protein [Austropuccinia psidii MF-1]